VLAMTTMGPFLPYPPGENEHRIAAADPGGGAPPSAAGFGEVEGEPDIVDDTPEPGAVDPVPISARQRRRSSSAPVIWLACRSTRRSRWPPTVQQERSPARRWWEG
jgi:hypothetical protein